MAFTLPQPRPWHSGPQQLSGWCFWRIFGWFVIDLVGSIPSRKELRAISDMASANILFDAADREVFTIAKEHRIEVPLTEISQPDQGGHRHRGSAVLRTRGSIQFRIVRIGNRRGARW